MKVNTTAGWKMILTSRNEGAGLHADPSCFPFRPKILTPEESWKLCESIAFPRREITGTFIYKNHMNPLRAFLCIQYTSLAI